MQIPAHRLPTCPGRGRSLTPVPAAALSSLSHSEGEADPQPWCPVSGFRLLCAWASPGSLHVAFPCPSPSPKGQCSPCRSCPRDPLCPGAPAPGPVAVIGPRPCTLPFVWEPCLQLHGERCAGAAGTEGHEERLTATYPGVTLQLGKGGALPGMVGA